MDIYLQWSCGVKPANFVEHHVEVGKFFHIFIIDLRLKWMSKHLSIYFKKNLTLISFEFLFHYFKVIIFWFIMFFFFNELEFTSPIVESTSSNNFFWTLWLWASTWLKNARTVLVVSYPAKRKVILCATISLSLKALLPSLTFEKSICWTRSKVLAFACKKTNG